MAGSMASDRDQPLHAMLAVDRAGNADRLVRRPEMPITADLVGDDAAHGAEPCQILAVGRLGNPPPDMQLGGIFGGAAAAFHQQRGRAQVLLQVRQLGGDVTCVEIDDDGLHLLDVLGAGLAVLGDNAGDDIDGRALARRSYLGVVTHQGRVYPGEHQAIVPQELWDRAHDIMRESPRVRVNKARRQTPRRCSAA